MLLATVPISFDAFRRQVDDLFAEAFRDAGQRPYPALNIWEDGDALQVEAELPGMAMSDLELLVEGQELTLKGRRPSLPLEGATLHRSERPSGAFARKLTLPADVDADRIEATLKDGVLRIRLPKSEKARARRIEVKAQ